MTRWLLTLSMIAGAPAASAAQAAGDPASAACERPAWPLWEAYKRHFITTEGRAVDFHAEHHSTSEGQSYALFFALVANDQDTFFKVLNWTRQNLAKGDVTKTLPAWRWGRAEDGTWGILDPNSASDSDMWIAYALLEAGRLWSHPKCEAAGKAMLARAVAAEVVDIPGLGPTWLPAPVGFHIPPDTWRLNPSYLPLQLLRRFEGSGVDGPWRQLIASSVAIIERASPLKLAADWVAYKDGVGFIVDPEKGSTGSYDGIRSYLWNAMLPQAEAHRAQLVAAGAGMMHAVKALGFAPEKVDAAHPDGNRDLRPGPVGFQAVMSAVAHASGDSDGVGILQARVAAAKRGDLYGDQHRYYDHNLLLFSEGFIDGRYAFSASGQLVPRWAGCQSEASP